VDAVRESKHSVLPASYKTHKYTVQQNAKFLYVNVAVNIVTTGL